MKLKLYHAAAAAAMALSVMLLTACGSPKQADPLPIIKLRTVGSSSEAACQRSIERTDRGKVWIYGRDLPTVHHQL